MFTGIVEEIGTVVAVEESSDARRLLVAATKIVTGLNHGDSISVSGVCLTATTWETTGTVTTVAFDVMAETLNRSSLGQLTLGRQVNLERAATMQTRLGGHLVQGHVDATGVVLAREHSSHWDVVTISIPDVFSKYVVEKGSIAVDGVSLTVSAVSDGSFSVSLIPTTLQETTLGLAQVGTEVNLEVDIIAKHVERLLEARDTQPR